MRRALHLVLLAACGPSAAPTAPAPAPHPSTAAHVELDTSPEPSPFQAAADAFKAERAADDQMTEALVRDVMHPSVGVALATLQRGATPTAAFGLKLDATEADIKKDFTIGPPACDGMIDRFCPQKNYVADLTPRAPSAGQPKLRGRFAGGKLYEIDAFFQLPEREYTPAEKRVMVRAFETEVRKVLGPPTRAAYSNIEYGPALVLRYALGNAPMLVMTGSLATRDKLQDEDTKLSDAEAAAEKAKEHARLCQCRHFEVGDRFPHDEDRRNLGYGMPADLHFTVLSVSPGTCTARVRVRYRYGGPIGDMDKSCTEIPAKQVSRPCLGCANR